MAAPVRSPEWWRDKLLPKLDEQARYADFYQRYYDGRFPDYGIVTDKYREAFAGMLRCIQDNWMQLVVDAQAERMHVTGFRFGDDPEADTDAWMMWQRNHLDSDSGLAHTTALICGKAFVLVAPGSDGPVMTVEHPTQMIVACDPGNRRIRQAALKRWVDDWTGATNVTLYLPDGLHRWSDDAVTASRWGRKDRWREGDPTPNPLGVVPVIPLLNRPTLFGAGRSELEAVTSTQDQINKLVCDMIVGSEFQAYQQRWGTGLELDIDPQTGEKINPFTHGQDRIWANPEPDGRFGAFPTANLGTYPKLLENRIQSIASRTRTPPHYMLGQTGQFPSGESLKATETGLIAKARAEMRHLEEGWEEAERLAFRIVGDPRSDEFAAETIWEDPESRTESEHVDALVKKLTIGVPMQQLWEDAGYSPQQIARFKTMAVEEALNRAIGMGTPAPVEQPAPPAPAVT